MKNFVKPENEVTDSEISEICLENDVKTSDRLIKFLRIRFKDEILSSTYIEEWVRRFKFGNEIQFADSWSKQILEKI